MFCKIEIYDILKRCDTTIIYFHCAQKGTKIELLRKNPHVCIEGEIFMQIEKTEHGITARYESIIGFGECTFVTDQEEIIHGMKLLTEHYGYDEYPLERCAGLNHLFVGKIILNEIYGKKNFPGSFPPADRAANALH